MRRYEREPDFDDSGTTPARAPVEWEYVPVRRRPGAPDGSLPVRLLLIDEGVRTVDQRGPGAVSVAACARRIGVSKGAPYTWFADAADFRAAVAASLVSSLVSELGTGPSADPVAQLAADVALVVRDWAANGMGVDVALAGGGPASEIELAWEADRFAGHVAARVHDASGCRCSTQPELCSAQRPLVDAVLALCHGYAALARMSAGGVESVAESAATAVGRLLAGTVAQERTSTAPS